MKRRDAMKGAAGVAAAAAPLGVIHAGNTWVDSRDGTDNGAHDQAAVQRNDLYTEKYKGRTITVSETDETVHIDGRPLPLMKMGEGAYLSALCHYRFASSPLVAGREAVDELRGANLLATGTHHA